MEIVDFKNYVENAYKNGLITAQERDDYFYDCALAQLENTDLYSTIHRIISEIESRN